MKIKKDDQVLIVRGKDKKRKGKILKVFLKEKKVIIEGLNLQKKHIRPKKEGEKGETLEVPTPLHSSNVKLICPRCKKPTRVGHKIIEKKKYRVCKKCKKEFL